MKVNFINTGLSLRVRDYFGSNIDNINLNDFENFNNRSEEKIKKSKKQILELQKIIIDDIKYLESNNYLIDNLPEEINVKFSNATILEKLNPIHRNNLAEIELNSNTIFISTDLIFDKFKKSLLGNKATEYSKELLFYGFKDVFTKEQSIENMFNHEFGHILFKSKFNEHLMLNLSLEKEHIEKEVKGNYSVLYQATLAIEENFCDLFSALICKEKNNLFDYYSYVLARNKYTENRIQSFDFNYYKITSKIDDLNKINTKSNPDEIMNNLYFVAVKNTVELLKEASSNNLVFKNKVLAEFNIQDLNKLNSDIVSKKIEEEIMVKKFSTKDLDVEAVVLNLVKIRNLAETDRCVKQRIELG